MPPQALSIVFVAHRQFVFNIVFHILFNIVFDIVSFFFTLSCNYTGPFDVHVAAQWGIADVDWSNDKAHWVQVSNLLLPLSLPPCLPPCLPA